jgi:hypothetical protein
MQVIASEADRPRRPAVAVALGLLFAGVLLVTGLALGYLAFGTTFVTQFALTPRPGPGQIVAGVLGWAFALTAPGVFLIVGVARIVTVVELVQSLGPRKTRISRYAAELSDEYVSAVRVGLPDGRVLPELVLGPFGIAVIKELPPRHVTRHHGPRWEVRLTTGKWVPMENPMDRASADAERVRRWIAEGDRDFVVKVYAAVLTDDPTIPKTGNCVILTPEQLPAWISSLPAQRSLTSSRRSWLLELIRSAI